jgi:hypothetical protein
LLLTQLKELVNIQSKKGYFSNDEMKMLSGALDFKKKSAMEIMTPMEKVFMISVLFLFAFCCCCFFVVVFIIIVIISVASLTSPFALRFPKT